MGSLELVLNWVLEISKRFLDGVTRFFARTQMRHGFRTVLGALVWSNIREGLSGPLAPNRVASGPPSKIKPFFETSRKLLLKLVGNRGLPKLVESCLPERIGDFIQKLYNVHRNMIETRLKP